MRIHNCLLVTALGLGVGSCGGGASVTTTVVQTVAPPAAAAAPTTAAPPAAEPSATTPSAASAPVADLPAGAVALQGRYRMKVVRVTNNSFLIAGQQADEKDAERAWVAETRCATGVCQVQLRRELTSGGFERSTLKQSGDDKRSFGQTTSVQKRYCGRPENSSGPAIKRTSVRITAVEDRGGQPTAVRIAGFVTLKQTCAGGGVRLEGRNALAFRGTLEG